MSGTYTSFESIPQFTKDGDYSVHLPWGRVEPWLDEMALPHGLELDPDFQRGHVWSPEQQVRYVEFVLRGGKSARQILFNQSGWGRAAAGRGEPVVLVDGKQRLEAVRGFLRGEVAPFGTKVGEFTDRMSMLGPQFVVTVNNLQTRAEVLQWYVDLNSGGTVHAAEEIERVRSLILGEAA